MLVQNQGLAALKFKRHRVPRRVSRLRLRSLALNIHESEQQAARVGGR